MNLFEQHHWNKVYNTKAEDEVSWFQPYPKISMEFVELFNLPLNANIIDIGGGDSHFVDALLDKGYQNIWVLDISTKAIERSKLRLGKRAKMVQWIVSDVTAFKPGVQFDFWHDRAAFHFLTTEDKIYKYVSIAEDAPASRTAARLSIQFTAERIFSGQTRPASSARWHCARCAISHRALRI